MTGSQSHFLLHFLHLQSFLLCGEFSEWWNHNELFYHQGKGSELRNLKGTVSRTMPPACSVRINKSTINIFSFETDLIIRKNNQSCVSRAGGGGGGGSESPSLSSLTGSLFLSPLFNEFDFKRFEDTVDREAPTDNLLLFGFSVLWGQTP